MNPLLQELVYLESYEKESLGRPQEQLTTILRNTLGTNSIEESMDLLGSWITWQDFVAMWKSMQARKVLFARFYVLVGPILRPETACDTCILYICTFCGVRRDGGCTACHLMFTWAGGSLTPATCHPLLYGSYKQVLYQTIQCDSVGWWLIYLFCLLSLFI